MRKLRAGLAVVAAVTVATGIAGCGGAVKHVADSQLGVESVRTATPTVPAGDVATLTRMGADAREFVSGTGNLLVELHSGTAGTASTVLRKAEALKAADDDLSREAADLHDQKLRDELSGVIGALRREGTDLKRIGDAITSGNAQIGNAAVRRLRTDFIKAHKAARQLKARGVTL